MTATAASKPDAFGEPVDEAFGRTLGLWDITLMGVGGTIGVGIFVLTGVAAAHAAGPAVVLSFLVAGLACGCAALCYAELASMIPGSGSAYVYVRATLGPLAAWIVGWNLVLEYLFAASTVAVGWSSYFQSLLALVHVHLPAAVASPPLACGPAGCGLRGAWVNLPAVAIVAACALLLMCGAQVSARVNAAITALKIGVILLVIGFGAMHLTPANLHPFVPPNTGVYGEFGWSGVVRAAGLVFFAYIGFDQVSTCAQEARDPRRDIPLAILLTLGICTLLYVGMAVVMTGLAPYPRLGVADPVYVAIAAGGASLAWLKPVVAVGATIGLTSAILITLYGQTRIFYAMARDGAMPALFARLSPRVGAPVIGTAVVGAAAALVAGFAPIEMLGELVSIGTLLAFAVVCVGVMALRRTRPDLPRRFRAPALFFVAPLGVAVSLYMMASLPWATWLRLAVWMALGAAVWFAMRRTPASGPTSPPLERRA